MKRAVTLFAVILCYLFAGVTGAAGKGVLPADAAALLDMEGQSYYLGHNLHADKFQKKVYSANYQLAGELLPWGAEVKILKVQRNYLSFLDVKSAITWNYWFSGKTRRQFSLKDHLQRVFVKDIEVLRARVAGLTELDRDGIYEGRALAGMSRAGVLIAMGYPPEFANREDLMTVRDWHYWVSRFDKITISFNRLGVVARVVD